MRIVAAARYFWPDLGGAQTHLRRLASAWAGAGHETTVLTCRWSPEWPADEVVDGFRTVRLPVSRVRVWGSLRFHRQIRHWLRAHRDAFDVVFVSMLKHAAYAVATSAGTLGKPFVLKAEGGGPTGDVAWQNAANGGRWIRRATLRADAVVAPSPAVAAEVAAAGYSRVVVLPNGVVVPDQPWTPAETSKYRRTVGIEDRATLLTTGRLSPEKGLMDLVAAMEKILQARQDVQLVLVGDGPERRRIEDAVRRRRLASRVRLVGQVSDVQPYLRAADLYLLPSRAEGLSLGLLEAVALGLPTLASDIESNRGIAPPFATALFPVGSAEELARAALRRLQEFESPARPELLAQIDAARKTFAQQFGIDVVARRYVELFRSVVEGGSPPHSSKFA